MNEVLTSIGEPLEPALLSNYFERLVGQFFKVLPIRESGEESLPVYIGSLQVELCGCLNLIPELHTNALYLTLLSILEYLKDNPDCSVKDVKRQVFKAISICRRLACVCADNENCGVIK